MPHSRRRTRWRLRSPPKGTPMRVHGHTAPPRVRRTGAADRPIQLRIGSTLVSMTDAEALQLADQLVDAAEHHQECP